MSKNKTEEAIEFLDTFKITNDIFKEHCMDLCVNKKTTEAFDKLTTAQKTAFTKAYNKEHKEPTAKKTGGKKGKGAADPVSSDSEDDDKYAGMEEDEVAEIKRGK